jgi:F-type H+-transporting ATPase subunit b
MELLTPGSGLLFWQVVVFVALLVLLKKFAWGPILQSLKIREESINDAHDAAKKSKEKIAKFNATKEYFIKEAICEREKMLKGATQAANILKEEAKVQAQAMSDKIVTDAKAEIEIQKNAALAEVKNQVITLSVEIAEKLMRKTLGEKGSQKSLVENYLKDKNLN